MRLSAFSFLIETEMLYDADRLQHEQNRCLLAGLRFKHQMAVLK